MKKLNIIANDSVMWGDNQIGFFVEDNTIEMCTSLEDFDNNDISDVDQKEISQNLPLIEEKLKSQGFKLVRS